MFEAVRSLVADAGPRPATAPRAEAGPALPQPSFALTAARVPVTPERPAPERPAPVAERPAALAAEADSDPNDRDGDSDTDTDTDGVGRDDAGATVVQPPLSIIEPVTTAAGGVAGASLHAPPVQAPGHGMPIVASTLPAQPGSAWPPQPPDMIETALAQLAAARMAAAEPADTAAVDPDTGTDAGGPFAAVAAAETATNQPATDGSVAPPAAAAASAGMALPAADGAGAVAARPGRSAPPTASGQRDATAGRGSAGVAVTFAPARQPEPPPVADARTLPEAIAAVVADDFAAAERAADLPNETPEPAALPATAHETLAGGEFVDTVLLGTHEPLPADTSGNGAGRSSSPLRPPAAAVSEQVAAQVAQALDRGISRFDIDLEPRTLGRIEVQLQLSRSGHVSALIVASQPETLDLLKADTRALAAILEDNGLKPDAGSLSFSLRDDRGGSGSGTGSGVPWAGGRIPAGSRAPEVPGDLAQPPNGFAAGYSATSSTRLDIRA